MADLNFTDQDLNSVLASAVLQALTPERREELFQGALTKFLGEATAGDRYRQSSFERAVTEAFSSAIRDAAKEYIQTPTVQRRFKKHLHEALDKAIDSRQLLDKMTENLAASGKLWP